MPLLTKSRMLMLLALFLIILAGLAVRAYQVAPRLEQVENSIRGLWSHSGDQATRVEGDPSFQILPPELTLSNAKIVTANGTVIKADQIRFGFELSALLSGDYAIDSVTIEGGTIAIAPIHHQPAEYSTEKILIDFISFFDRTPRGENFQSVRLIRFRNTAFDFMSAGHPVSIPVSNAEFDRKADGSIDLSGFVTWHQKPFAITVALGPSGTTSSDGRSTSFAVESESAKFFGQGTTAFDQNLQFLGTIRFSSSNLKTVEAITATRLPSLPSATVKLEAMARLSFSAITLSAMQIRIGEADITGNMIADYAMSPARVTGTFAANAVDLSDITKTIGIKRNALGQWSTDPLAENLVPDIDLDLRLSADRVHIHDVTIANVALSALMRNQRAELTLASANLLDGALTGKIEFADIGEAGRYEAAANIAFDKLDLEKLGLALLDSKRIAGLASGRLTLRTSGQSSAAMISDLSGNLDLASEANRIEGVDLLAFLRRIEARPIGAVLGIKSGTSEFDTGELMLVIRNGTATLSKAKLTKFPDLQVRLTGSLDLVQQNFAISGHALGSSARSAERAIDLPFSLEGPFNDPAFVPDFTNVSKQSGAITP